MPRWRSHATAGAASFVEIFKEKRRDRREEQGLKAGDVIVAVGGEAVTRAADATKKLDAAKADKQPVMLLISRQGVTRFVVVKASVG